MDKQDEQLFDGLRHFSKYLHGVANSSELKKDPIVMKGCRIVAHVADAVLHAAEELEADAKK